MVTTKHEISVITQNSSMSARTQNLQFKRIFTQIGTKVIYSIYSLSIDKLLRTVWYEWFDLLNNINKGEKTISKVADAIISIAFQ